MPASIRFHTMVMWHVSGHAATFNIGVAATLAAGRTVCPGSVSRNATAWLRTDLAPREAAA